MAPGAPAQATLIGRAPPGTPAGRSRPATGIRTARTVRAEWEPQEADPPLAEGAVIDGRYRVVALIGEGGMGRVYETEHLFLRRRLALKLVRRDAGTGEAAARLLQEAVLAGQVSHATVVPVFDCAALPDGQVYVAMELLRGESLESALLRPQPADAALRWLAEVGRGLAAAHRAGIVHRDVKPANIFLADGGGAVQPRILDFGIAKLLPGLSGDAGAAVQTQAGALLGTPFYMAPERARGATGDGRADLYSLGVILYEVLTGDVPFLGESFMEIAGRHLHEAPLDPRQAAPGRKIPDALAELALALLHKEPEGRPADGDVVAAALDSLRVREAGALAGLMLGAGGGGPAAPAEAVTQAIVAASTQRLDSPVLGDRESAVLGDRVEEAGVGTAPTEVVAVPQDMSEETESPKEQVATDMSQTTAEATPGRWLRTFGLVAACAIGGGLVAWTALERIGGSERAVRAGPEVAPAATPGPANETPAKTPVTPEPRADATPPIEPAGTGTETGSAGTGTVPVPEAITGAERAPEAGTGGETAGKKRGKKPPRKAGTTEPGPVGPGPKIKTDVYDE